MSPAGVADDWGEPPVGVNPKTEQTFNGIPNGGTVMGYGGINVPYAYAINFDDSVPSSPVANWSARTLSVAALTRPLGDPILFTDQQTGRTFVSQLLGGPKQSTMEYTDDNGTTLAPSMGSGIFSGVDHQTVGGGPLAPPLTGNPAFPSYKNGVYYCAQDVGDANCAISLDGGRTFGPAVPIFSVADCAGLHGHIKVAPDGTAYVPNKGCGGDLPFHENSKQAVIASENKADREIRKVRLQPAWNLRQTTVLGIATDGNCIRLRRNMVSADCGIKR